MTISGLLRKMMMTISSGRVLRIERDVGVGVYCGYNVAIIDER